MTTHTRKALDAVTLTVTTCRECPHAKEGPGYSLDGWDHGNDWQRTLAGKQLVAFVERRSERIDIPKWCPLRKKSAGGKHD